MYGPLKVLFQIWSIWLVLGYRTKPAKWLLVQVRPKSLKMNVCKKFSSIHSVKYCDDLCLEEGVVCF